MVIVNGEKYRSIDVSDRGFQYGDGLFETIEVNNGKPVFFDRHWRRLQAGCERLFIPCPPVQLLAREIHALIEDAARAVLKINITRGSGGRGYDQPETVHPTRVLSLHPVPDYPDTYRSQGIKARFCQLRLGVNPLLAGLKHMNRLEQVLARREWQDPAIQEGLLLDHHEHVIEGTMSNLFIIRDAVLVTPLLDSSGVAGIIREIILEAAEQFNLTARQQHLSRQDILEADEAFVTNSIIGLWPIKHIAGRDIPVGPHAQKISRWLAAYKQQCDETTAVFR